MARDQLAVCPWRAALMGKLSDLLSTRQFQQADPLFGFPIREQLFPSEDSYFKKNPTVAGMAAETNDIILNPYAGADVNRDAVARNEALRLQMRGAGVTPDFKLSPEQLTAFKGTPYAANQDALRASIAARIYSGDPSAQETAQQRTWVENYLAGIQ